ncbi:MAG: site-specific integrase, partial [Chloroflexota bacterium]|nr:site-specific integrase [Chloroflexota bacterium]
SEASKRSMAGKLGSIARLAGYPDALSCPWTQLRYQHTAAIRAQLSQAYKPSTANCMLAALRGVLKEAWQLGLMPVEEYSRAVALKSVKGHTLPKGRALGTDELRRLLGACDGGARGRRDAAMLAVLAGGGLRRSEAVGLDVGDYEAGVGALRMRAGKGNKERVTYLPAWAREAVDKWITLHPTLHPALLLPINKAGRIESRRLSSQAVLDVLQRIGERAGVEEFAPHDMRRTFITSLLDAGVDLHVRSQLAGHASVETTKLYDRPGEQAKMRAVERLGL